MGAPWEGIQTAAYKQGVDDYDEGISYEQCPHVYQSPEYFEWQEGWIDAEARDVASHDYD